MRQWLADAPRAHSPCAVERHYRRALRQAVTFEHRQTDRLGPREQAWRNPSAAYRHQTQRADPHQPAFDRCHQPHQQLRHKDQALRTTEGDCAQQALEIDLARASHPQLLLRIDLDTSASHERGVDAQVFQQNTQWQYRQVSLRLGWAAGGLQLMRHTQQGFSAQAHAFGRAGATGGVSDLGCALRQRRGDKTVTLPHASWRLPGKAKRNELFGPLRLAHDRRDSALLQAVLELGRAEKRRHCHSGAFGEQRRQIPE
ncbi:hypothetical protein D9M71_184620 [compost metagenome]